jgi:hypothetical protein
MARLKAIDEFPNMTVPATKPPTPAKRKERLAKVIQSNQWNFQKRETKTLRLMTPCS